MNVPTVSVVFAVYGTVDRTSARAAILSALRQKEVAVEVIVVEAGNLSATGWLNVPEISHVAFRTRPGKQFRPGFFRNIGLLRATADRVYFSDADILFSHDHYLAHSLALLDGADGVLIHPPKLRIPIEQAPIVASGFCANGWTELSALRCEDRRFACLEEPVVYREIAHRGRIYTAREADYQEWNASGRQRASGPMVWQDIYHPGGTLASRKALLRIGGYGHEFAIWGYEDADLQHRLALISSLKTFPDKKDFWVFHLDHSRGYISSEAHFNNKEIYERRCNLEQGELRDADRQRLKRLQHALRLHKH